MILGDFGQRIEKGRLDRGQKERKKVDKRKNKGVETHSRKVKRVVDGSMMTECELVGDDLINICMHSCFFSSQRAKGGPFWPATC